MIIGTPGSGKTTMGRLFQFSTIVTALQNESLDSHRALIASLSECGAVKRRAPALLGTRVPLESEYREFWDFPYPDDLKLGLMTALIQARAVLGWVHELRAKGVDLADVKFVGRGNAKAALEAIGGSEPQALYNGRQKSNELCTGCRRRWSRRRSTRSRHVSAAAYRPFDVIDYVPGEIRWQVGDHEATDHPR